MRLWVICLQALLFIGLLIAIGQSGLFDTIMGRNVRLGDPLFEDYQRGSIPFIDVDGRDVFVAQSHPDNPLILSGFPAYASKLFRLPTDSRPLSGTYNIAFATDAVPDAEGALRISINGVKRADVVLNQGRFKRRAKIELTPAELASGQLEVKLALVGRGPMAECTPNEALAAVVTILPESGLHLKLDKAPSTTRDRLALWGDLIPVKWDEDDKVADLATLLAAARLSEKGYGIYFGESGYAAQALTDIDKGAAIRPDRTQALRYPVSLVSAIENGGARRFDRETTWRYRYDVGQLPNGELPSALDLRLLLGPIAETRTALFVTLNDHLLFTRTLTDEDQRFSHSIALPTADHLDRNQLEITLTAHEREEMRCGARRLIAAEMLPETILRGGGERLVPAIVQLRGLLAANRPVALKAGALTAPQGQATAQLLGQMRPSALAFGTQKPGTTIEVLTGDIAAALARVRPAGRQWLVHFPDDRREGVMVEPFARGASAAGAAVALLVTVHRPVPVPLPATPATTPLRATAPAP